MWIDCGVFFGPVLVSLALIIGGLSSVIVDWSDLKARKVIVAEIGIVLLALGFAWMYIQFFRYQDTEYLHLFVPALIGLAVTVVGILPLRHDPNFVGADYAYSGVALYVGSLLWIVWVIESFT